MACQSMAHGLPLYNMTHNKSCEEVIQVCTLSHTYASKGTYTAIDPHFACLQVLFVSHMSCQGHLPKLQNLSPRYAHLQQNTPDELALALCAQRVRNGLSLSLSLSLCHSKGATMGQVCFTAISSNRACPTVFIALSSV